MVSIVIYVKYIYVFCVVTTFGMKIITSVTRRSVLGKMHMDVIYVEKYILWRKPCMYTKERYHTDDVCYVVFLYRVYTIWISHIYDVPVD